MKRMLGFIMAALLVFSLAACTSTPKGEESSAPEATNIVYKDGTYHAIYDRMDVRNWKAFVDITVEEGKIKEVNYDYVNDAGELRSVQQGYIDGFKAANGFTPREGFDQLAEKLIEVQDIEQVDAVSGATHSSRNFNALCAAALEKAVAGDDSDTIVPLYADGNYRVEADKVDEHGWKPFVEVEIKDHNIAAVNFDYVNDEGKLKSEDADYQKNMEDVTGTYPEKYEGELAAELMSKQVISLVDGVSGATTSTGNFKTLVEVALDDMAEIGETGIKKISLAE